jgi:hypothetical protein
MSCTRCGNYMNNIAPMTGEIKTRRGDSFANK